MSIMVLLVFFVALALVAALYAVVGVFVYRDARRRGMNAPLWTLVVILVPSFIGLIVYLLARNSLPEGNQCVKCGTSVNDTFLACPKCGAELAAPCPGCGKQVSREWKVCPYCKAELPAPQQVTKAARRMSPGLIAAIVILAVLVLAGLAVALVSLPMVFNGNISSSTTEFLSVTNNSDRHMTGSFVYMDGTKSKTVNMVQGQVMTLKLDLLAESGDITLEILDPSGKQLQMLAGTYGDTITVGALMSGDYVIKLKMDKCKGHYDLSWTI